jgi:hypothetical protein
MNAYQDMIEDMNKARARQEKAMLALKKAKESEARANKKQAVVLLNTLKNVCRVDFSDLPFIIGAVHRAKEENKQEEYTREGNILLENHSNSSEKAGKVDGDNRPDSGQ